MNLFMKKVMKEIDKNVKYEKAGKNIYDKLYKGGNLQEKKKELVSKIFKLEENKKQME